MWYGLRQFSMADPDGYIITLNQQVAQPDSGAGEGEAENTQGQANGE
jgi:hypothetical protein